MIAIYSWGCPFCLLIGLTLILSLCSPYSPWLKHFFCWSFQGHLTSSVKPTLMPISSIAIPLFLRCTFVHILSSVANIVGVLPRSSWILCTISVHLSSYKCGLLLPTACPCYSLQKTALGLPRAESWKYHVPGHPWPRTSAEVWKSGSLPQIRTDSEMQLPPQSSPWGIRLQLLSWDFAWLPPLPWPAFLIPLLGFAGSLS